MPLSINGNQHGGSGLLRETIRDARIALRAVMRAKRLSSAIFVTMALAVGGATVAFSVVDAMYLRTPDGIQEPAALRRLLVVRNAGTMQTPSGGPGFWDDYDVLRQHAPALSGVAAYLRAKVLSVDRGPAAGEVAVSLVSHNFFDVLGAKPTLGRAFRPSDDVDGSAEHVAVISNSLWMKRFGRSNEVLGKRLLLNGTSLEIVGVAPAGFMGAPPQAAEVWVPSAMGTVMGLVEPGWRTSTLFVHLVARLGPGISEPVAARQAESALSRAATRDPSLDQSPEVRFTSLLPGPGTTSGALSQWLFLVSLLALFAAAANVTTLFWVRNSTRDRETAVRLALGARRSQLVRQYAMEGLILGLCAAACGLVLAAWSLALLDYFPDPVPAARIDVRIVGFALGLSVALGVAASISAAWRAVRATNQAPLYGARVLGNVSGHRVRHRLLSVQIALAVILLVCANLFVRSAVIAMAVDTGVDDDHLLVAGVDFSGGSVSYPSDVREHFYEEAVKRLTSLPAIRGASFAQFAPLSGGSRPGAWSLSSDRKGIAPLNTVGDGYFETVGTPIVAGRSFDATDAAGSPVAVVNQTMARMIAEDGNVVGTCVAMQRQLKNGGCTLIIGVAKTQRSRYLADAQAPMIFIARSQVRDAESRGSPVVLVRTADDPALHVSAVHTALQGLAPSLPYVAVRPLSDSFKTDLLPFRLGALLFSAFGLLTLALTAVGLFGVLLQFVNDRQAEIGVRRAMGGSSLAIASLILRQGFSSLLAGVSIGMTAAFVGTGYLASLLFGVPARDPLSFVTAGTVVVLTTLLSTLVPLLRGLRVDAAVAIRQGAQ